MKNAAYIHPWRNWITQQIPILENGGSNPFGWAKKIKDTIVVVSFAFCNTKKSKGFEADRKKVVVNLF